MCMNFLLHLVVSKQFIFVKWYPQFIIVKSCNKINVKSSFMLSFVKLWKYSDQSVLYNILKIADCIFRKKKFKQLLQN